jgi:hypothetical protein
MLNQVLDLGIGREQHIDLCNVTEIIEERQLGDIFAMTWRWVMCLFFSDFSESFDLMSLLTRIENEFFSCLCWMTWWIF